MVVVLYNVQNILKKDSCDKATMRIFKLEVSTTTNLAVKHTCIDCASPVIKAHFAVGKSDIHISASHNLHSYVHSTDGSLLQATSGSEKVTKASPLTWIAC